MHWPIYYDLKQLQNQTFIMVSKSITNYLFLALMLLATPWYQQVSAQQTREANNILYYLQQEADAITNNFSPGVISPEEWEKIKPEHYDQFVEMMGFSMDKKRTPPPVTHTGTLQENSYKIEKFYYASSPGLYVPANLYVPDGIQSPRPAILYLCGHAHGQKAHYQAHARRLAELGFVVLIFDTLQFGEVWGHHWGPYNQGWFHWYSRGYNPAAVELWNAIRGLDYLATRNEVDMGNIGVTGISGGGSQSWYMAAADPRVKAAAPVCGAGTLDSQVGERRIDGHCDCMMPNNGFQIDFQTIGALIAPRPLLIAQSDQDELYGIASTRDFYQKLSAFYAQFEAEDNISLVATPGGHSYHEKSRKAIFSFFLHHLMGKDIPPTQLSDISTEPSDLQQADNLKVYGETAPQGDLTPVIQDHFIKTPSPPDISNEEDLNRYRHQVKDYLLTRTFGAFPQEPEALDGQQIYHTADLAPYGNKTFSFTSEKGWRLKLNVFYRKPPEERHPLTIILRSPGEERWGSESFAQKVAKGQNVAYLEVRGTGEVGWAPELNWHVRRAAAWTGRTLASMQVYDAGRALEYARTLPGVDPEKVSIAARDGMGAVALYAAFLDEQCEQVFLQNPPSTHDKESPENGRDVALELLNVLRVTDVYQLPALISPTRVVFEGKIPEAFYWSEEVLEKTGRPTFLKGG
ncbi:dienelactone hydrolase family protein [Cyclobacterium sp. SYSU L10401]|uniref:dienelactone hydrolase family protein n=1 Tax=unclassified Cyclobacterium TaxID=2615055 RepID=UPI0013D2FB9C|nr:dienelactone hydrolase family protein [Cyclobacterium sp. SYSU L10401]